MADSGRNTETTEEPTAMIALHRERRRWLARAVAFKIVVDGDELTAVRNGQSVSEPISPGTHDVRLTKRRGSPASEVITFTIADGETAVFRCRPKFRLWKRDLASQLSLDG
jgi:hypothetical protein